MTTSPLLPSTNDLIGQQMLHLERRLSEVLFKSEAPVLIECGGGVDPIQAVIKAIVGSIAFVQFCDEKTLDEVKLDQLLIGISPYPTSPFSCDNLFSLRNLDGNQLMKSIDSYIQVGHFFELIDKQDPKIVRTVKIVGNRNGFVRVVDANGFHYSVLLSSEHCKRIGWSLLGKNDGIFRLEPFLGTTIKTTLPWFLFDRNQLREHTFEINQILEVIDPITRYRIIPGIVIEVINKYFFKVGLIHSQYKQTLTTVVCHRGSPDLLFANFCSKASLRLSIPEGMDESNFSIITKNRGRHATENMFDIPKNVERFDTNRRIEIYDEKNECMIPAIILRQHRHLLAVRLENEHDFAPPKLYAYYDERIFNVGAAERYGIHLASKPEHIDRSCWAHKLDYLIVTKPSLHDPANGQRFMSRAFSDATQFLPHLYVNYECYKGPFINEETARFIDTQIASSHFQPIMRYIIHCVLENVIKFEYQKYAAAQPQSLAPTYTIKLTNPKSDKRSRSLQVEVCEAAEQFPEWLRHFLIRLEICPNFISPVKRIPGRPCPLGCHLVSEKYPYMAPGQHIHNPSTFSRLEEQRVKRMNANNSSSRNTGSSTLPPAVKRSRNNLGDSAHNSDHNDLDEPLSTRRARRNIIATKRHEIVVEEPAAWKRRQLAGGPQPLQATGSIPGQQRRRRNTSTDFVSHDGSVRSASYNAQNVPPRTSQNSKEYLMEMANRIDETIRGNLSSWGGAHDRSTTPNESSNGFYQAPQQQRHHEVIRAAAVRKANGPRMLFPQQMMTGRGNVVASAVNNTSFPSLKPIRTNDLPPRLHPIASRQPPTLQQAAKLEDTEEFDDDTEEFYIDDEEDLQEAPRLSAIRPSASAVVMKEEDSEGIPQLKAEEPAVQHPQIQEYLRRTRQQDEQKISPTDSSLQADSSSSLIKLPAVQLEKPGEYDTEIAALRNRPSSAKSSSMDVDELLAKYELSSNENPVKWENQELVEFMRKNHSQEVAEFLEKEEFDGQSFFMIEEEEIKDMKLKRGPELNLKRLLKELKEISDAFTARQ